MSSINQPSVKARILVVEDHPIMRRALAEMLNSETDFVVCGEAAAASQAMVAIAALKPDVVITCVGMTRINGIDFTREAILRWPGLLILLLSMHDESLYAEQALRAGAKGYVMKHEAAETLITALRRVVGGHNYVSAKLADAMMRNAAGCKVDGAAERRRTPKRPCLSYPSVRSGLRDCDMTKEVTVANDLQRKD